MGLSCLRTLINDNPLKKGRIIKVNHDNPTALAGPPPPTWKLHPAVQTLPACAVVGQALEPVTASGRCLSAAWTPMLTLLAALASSGAAAGVFFHVDCERGLDTAHGTSAAAANPRYCHSGIG